MSGYRNALPQLQGQPFLADGGLETTMVFHEGIELPYFAAFHMLRSPEGTAILRKYFRTYAGIARAAGRGIILETATWRASSDWGNLLGYTAEELADVNTKAVTLLEEIRREFQTVHTPVVISGCIGPRGDGYVPAGVMTEEEAREYHSIQVGVFAATAADMVCATTMNYSAEAVGIVGAARNAGIPAAVSFTVETDGHLPTGQSLKDAIREVDEATSGYPVYYMINCAHPTHFEDVLVHGDPAYDRIRGLRANASARSHAELNEAPDLDPGNPEELGLQYARIATRLRRLNVFGGCCGTDHRHIERIAEACLPLFEAPAYALN